MKTTIIALAAILGMGSVALAQSPLSAESSNPETLGWMQGFPPPSEKTIRFTDPDYFAFPKLRWTVCHFRELMPSVAVRGGGRTHPHPPRSTLPSMPSPSRRWVAERR